MSSIQTRFPTVASLFSKTASAPSAKVAEVSDPGPDSGHPASVGSDAVSVPEGDVLSKADAFTKDAMPTTGVQPSNSAVADKPATSMNTETGKDGSEISGLEPTGTVKDVPGQDSGHPAQAGEEKYAGVDTVDGVLSIILGELDSLAAAGVKQAAAALEEARQKTATAPDFSGMSLEQRTAYNLNEILPEGADQRQFYNQKVASFLEPLVQEGIARADRFFNYVKLASEDPALAAELMGGGGGGMPPGADAGMAMDPAAMGGDPAAAGGAPAMGGDPGAMGGDPGAGGGDETAQLMQIIEQIAQETGQSPEALIEQLMQMDSGGAPGGDPTAGGAAPPVEGGGSPEGGAPSDAPSSDEPKEGGFPGTPKQQQLRGKIAQLLAGEVGKTPAQVASNC